MPRFFNLLEAERSLAEVERLIRGLIAIEEHAQNGLGSKRAAQRTSEFLCCLAARIRALCASKQAYEDVDSQLTGIAQRIALAGGMIPPRERAGLLRRRKDAAGRSLKAAFDKVQNLGCQLKDLETGLVDFPTLYRDQEVYLCWRLGEPGITFWHHVTDGFGGRRPIDSEFLENHCGGAE